MIRSLQQRIWDWAVYAFGAERTTEVRGFRFTEEALELAQAVGLSKEQVLQLVDYVYGRPQGDVDQEIGGVMITLNNLASAHTINVEGAAEAELLRVWQKVEKIRAKERLAVPGSVLPGNLDTKG